MDERNVRSAIQRAYTAKREVKVTKTLFASQHWKLISFLAQNFASVTIHPHDIDIGFGTCNSAHCSLTLRRTVVFVDGFHWIVCTKNTIRLISICQSVLLATNKLYRVQVRAGHSHHLAMHNEPLNDFFWNTKILAIAKNARNFRILTWLCEMREKKSIFHLCINDNLLANTKGKKSTD